MFNWIFIQILILRKSIQFDVIVWRRGAEWDFVVLMPIFNLHLNLIERENGLRRRKTQFADSSESNAATPFRDEI